MNRKTMPLILMLTAGAVTCIITFVRNYSILNKLLALLVTLVIFYILGSVLKWTLDFFDSRNEKSQEDEGEETEKEPENGEGESEDASREE